MVLNCVNDEESIWEKWKSSRDPHAGNTLVKKYLPLVNYHVQRIASGLPKNVSRDDLKSLGLTGLYQALERFDSKRDLKFDTYASFRIRGAILDGLRKEDWLPRSLREKSKIIEATIDKLEQKNQRTASIKEIAQELDMSENEVYNTMNEYFFAHILSIDEQPIDGENNYEGHSFLIKDMNTDLPEEQLVKNEMIDELAEEIASLNKNEQLVVSLFYKEELTLTEIGQVMGLSTSRISQIHSKAIFKLRQALGKFIPN
ncbi:FliA/WhiG family RNA polymerase sigma factor [Bacillus sp. 03113]|uniref:FliA/WhiG family RNA polymerase sigma factor n=1 Tax=Bacillus sp. 03113 TaxID=2578211 RepID=UPI001143B8D6|nr:FliA/WhiG family RNA polymerase sigma factor [Bacillus sp. 03113]